MNRYSRMVFIMTAAILSGWMGNAAAAPVILADNNSLLTIEDTGNGLGANNWQINGVNQLFFESVWIGVGNSPEANIATLNLSSVTTLDTNSSGFDDLAAFVFDDPNGNFSLGISYQLLGENRGPGSAEYQQQISIQNTSGAELDLRLYSFSDFDIGATIGDDFAVGIDDSPFTIRQKDPVVERFIDTPSFQVDRFQVDDPAAIFALLEDNFATDLLFDSSVFLPPTFLDDVGFAYQYNLTLGVGEIGFRTIQRISQVPEPNSAILLGLALFVMGLAVRRGTISAS